MIWWYVPMAWVSSYIMYHWVLCTTPYWLQRAWPVGRRLNKQHRIYQFTCSAFSPPPNTFIDRDWVPSIMLARSKWNQLFRTYSSVNFTKRYGIIEGYLNHTGPSQWDSGYPSCGSPPKPSDSQLGSSPSDKLTSCRCSDLTQDSALSFQKWTPVSVIPLLQLPHSGAHLRHSKSCTPFNARGLPWPYQTLSSTSSPFD